MKMGLRSPPAPSHDVVEVFVKGQTVSSHGNVTGHAVLLAHPAHTQRRGGARIGGVALDDQDTPRHAILAEIVGNTRAHNPPSDNHHLSGSSHAGSLLSPAYCNASYKARGIVMPSRDVRCRAA